MGVAVRRQSWCHPCLRQNLFLLLPVTLQLTHKLLGFLQASAVSTVGTLRFQRCTQSPVFTWVLRTQTRVSTCATSVLPTGPSPQCGLEFSDPQLLRIHHHTSAYSVRLEPKTFRLYRKHSPTDAYPALIVKEQEWAYPRELRS